MAEDHEPPFPHRDLAGALAFSLHQPPGVEAGDGVADLQVEHMVPLSRDLKEPGVGPDDLFALGAEDHHGQGGVGHGVLGRCVHVVGDVFQIAQHLFPIFRRPPAEIEEEDQHDDPLNAGQKVFPRPHGGYHKGGQEKKVQPEAGFQQMRQTLFGHDRSLLSKGCDPRKNQSPYTSPEAVVISGA